MHILCCDQSLNHVQLFETTWTVYPARLFCPWEFSRQEYWSGLPCPPPGDLSNLGIKLRFSELQVGSLPSDPRILERVQYIPSPEDLPDPGIEPESPALQSDY